MQIKEPADFIFVGIAAILTVIVYVFLWNKNRTLAVALLLALTLYLSNSVIDFRQISDAFYINWGSGGFQPRG